MGAQQIQHVEFYANKVHVYAIQFGPDGIRPVVASYGIAIESRWCPACSTYL